MKRDTNHSSEEKRTGDGKQAATTSRNGAAVFSALMFLAPASIVTALTWHTLDIYSLLLACLIGLLFFMAFHITFEWERAVVMRFGKFHRIAGPGIYAIIPFVEFTASTIDQRVRTLTFEAEETLSADLVPINVDTVLFWVVWDVERACKQVYNYEAVISLAAQTAMRDVIGQISLSEIAMRRQFLDEELKRIITEKVGDWGVDVVSVEIRDIVIPKELQSAMSRQAQAERERDARFLLAEAERDISEIYMEAAETYGEPEKALQLRTMNLVYDSVREKGGMVVVPSAYSEGFNDVASATMKDLLK